LEIFVLCFRIKQEPLFLFGNKVKTKVYSKAHLYKKASVMHFSEHTHTHTHTHTERQFSCSMAMRAENRDSALTAKGLILPFQGFLQNSTLNQSTIFSCLYHMNWWYYTHVSTYSTLGQLLEMHHNKGGLFENI
jgi:hypothetical protein